MKERAILFSGPMVRALLAGAKTQTRRVVKPQPTGFVSECGVRLPDGTPDTRMPINDSDHPAGRVITCPYGVPGDRLRVRETFFAYGRWETRYSKTLQRDEWRFVDMTIETGRSYHYAASGNDFPLSTRRDAAPGWHKRSALFMPRMASRITLEIVATRIERLNDCSEQDAVAEGIGADAEVSGAGREALGIGAPSDKEASARGAAIHTGGPSAILAYRNVWESINGAGSWSLNPWIWVVAFRQLNR